MDPTLSEDRKGVTGSVIVSIESAEHCADLQANGAWTGMPGRFVGGGWKSTRMPPQYAEKINAAPSGMARAAEKSVRDSVSN